MATRKLLSDVIDEYLASRRTQMAPATVRADEGTLRGFLAHVGNIQVANITPAHAERYRAWRSTKVGPHSMNAHLAILRAFFRWTSQMRLTTVDPLVTWRFMKVLPKEKLYIPAADFPALLDAANHPRDRIFIALGLYLFTRQGETVSLKIKDVDMTRDEIQVTVHKTKQRDLMPICSELGEELERWFAYYRQDTGTGLHNDWYLVPAKTNTQWSSGPDGLGRTKDKLTPDVIYGRSWRSVQRALTALDLPFDSGEGGHTLRRSGARALYDHLVEQGHDFAIRRCQSMLHHSSIAMTERYLGITADIRARNKMLAGAPMFGPAQPATLAMVVGEGGGTNGEAHDHGVRQLRG